MQIEGEGVCFGSHFEGTGHHGGKSRQQELEVTGHITSTVRRQNDECLCSAHFLFFTKSRIKPREWGHIRWAGFPTTINLEQDHSLKCAERFIFHMVLDLIQLKTEINHHNSAHSKCFLYVAWLYNSANLHYDSRTVYITILQMEKSRHRNFKPPSFTPVLLTLLTPQTLTYEQVFLYRTTYFLIFI